MASTDFILIRNIPDEEVTVTEVFQGITAEAASSTTTTSTTSTTTSASESATATTSAMPDDLVKWLENEKACAANLVSWADNAMSTEDMDTLADPPALPALPNPLPVKWVEWIAIIRAALAQQWWQVALLLFRKFLKGQAGSTVDLTKTNEKLQLLIDKLDALWGNPNASGFITNGVPAQGLQALEDLALQDAVIRFGANKSISIRSGVLNH
jgi:hypothetical protein